MDGMIMFANLFAFPFISCKRISFKNVKLFENIMRIFLNILLKNITEKKHNWSQQ